MANFEFQSQTLNLKFETWNYFDPSEINKIPIKMPAR
jgi:hypothetical protein